MRKIFAAVLFVFFVCSECFAFVSSDTQLILSRLDNIDKRLDKMDVKIDGMNKRLDDFQVYMMGQYDALNKRIDDTNKRIDDLQASTNKRFDDLRDDMNSGFVTLDSRIYDLRHVVYWGIAILGLCLGYPIYGPALKKFFESFENRGITIEDVEKYLTMREKKKESEKYS